MFTNLLNITCTIESQTSAQNADTGEFVETWTTYASSVPCRLTGASGGEKRSSKDILANMTHKLFLDYRTDLTWNGYRIVVGSNTYNILCVINAGGESHHTELLLEIVQ